MGGVISVSHHSKTTMNLDEKFQLAVNYIQNLPPSGPYNPSNDEKLQFYSLYKQATIGPCKQKKPSFYDLIAKAKWDAWTKISKLSKDDAKKKYVTLFTRVAKKINNEESREVLKKITSTAKSVAPAAASGEEENVVHLYGIMLSQPTRSVFWFCKINAIPMEFHEVNLAAGEQRSKEFTKINPHQKVPVVLYQGKAYYESHTIIRMLAQNFPIANNWYPSEFEKRLEVEQYLDWHHLNTRKACATLVFLKFFLPMRGKPVPEERVKEAEKDVHLCLKAINNIFLSGKEFISGDSPSVADLFAYNEIIQMDLINGEHRNDKKYPNVVAWLHRVSLLPEHNEMYEPLRLLIPSSKL